MKDYCFCVEEEYEGVRLDKGISLMLEGEFSRSFLSGVIKEGKVFVNNIPQKASYSLKEGDQISFELPDNMLPDILPQDMNLDILYEDDDVIVINKPKNMVVHPANGHYSDTMVNGLMYHCRDSLSGINGVMRPGIVHRIDKNTTGSVIACKNDAAHRAIAGQLADHSLNRRYRAICIGNIEKDDITIDVPIGRDDKDKLKMSTHSKSAKRAVTHVHVLERFKGYTYVECRLETGRTHQIRVHMASIGKPLLGDEMYGGKGPFKLEGQCLHAYILGFIHPVSGEYIETVAPLPEYFENLLKKLRNVVK